jgi:hypothetical protein
MILNSNPLSQLWERARVRVKKLTKKVDIDATALRSPHPNLLPRGEKGQTVLRAERLRLLLLLGKLKVMKCPPLGGLIQTTCYAGSK